MEELPISLPIDLRTDAWVFHLQRGCLAGPYVIELISGCQTRSRIRAKYCQANLSRAREADTRGQTAR